MTVNRRTFLAGAGLSKPEFVSDLKALADAGLVMDTANPNLALISAVVRTTDLVPNLRIVMDHFAWLETPVTAATRAGYEVDMRGIAKRPQVYAKVSHVLSRVCLFERAAGTFWSGASRYGQGN